MDDVVYAQNGDEKRHTLEMTLQGQHWFGTTAWGSESYIYDCRALNVSQSYETRVAPQIRFRKHAIFSSCKLTQDLC